MKVIIEREHGGQSRPYADSVYSGFITIERDGELLEGATFYQEISRTLALSLARLLIRDFTESPGAFDTYLDEARPVGPTAAMCQRAHPKWTPKADSRWYIKIVQPYCD